MSPQMTGDLPQKVEAFLELENDYEILAAKLQDNQREYSILQRFCSARLVEPGFSLRRAYGMQKFAEFNAKDADLRAQLQKLALALHDAQAEIQELQRTGER